MQIEARYIDSREEWLRWRMQDVTGSDLGALAGCDKNKSARALYEEKVSGLVDDADNDAMRRGRIMEPAIVAALQEAHPDWEIEDPKVYLHAPEHRLGGTPDRIAHLPDGTKLLIECKSVTEAVYERDWADGAPLKHNLQTLDNAMLAGCEGGLLAVLVFKYMSVDLKEHPVPRHAQAEQSILDMVAAFWDRVAAQTPPDFDFSADADLIRAVYGKPSLPSVDLSTDNRIGELCEQKLEWAERRKNAEAALKEIDAEICARLGEAEVAEHPAFNISWKLQKRSAYSVPENEFRVLRVTQKKKEAKAA